MSEQTTDQTGQPDQGSVTISESAIADAVDAIRQLRPEPVDLAEPEDDETDDLSPVLVSNGWVRMTIGGEKYKLRRPFLGELEALEATIDTHRRELTDLHDSMNELIEADIARAQEIETEARALNGQNPQRKIELDDEATKLGMQAMDRSKQIAREASRLRAEWWRQAFELLTPPAYSKPEQLPAWARDANLQMRVMEHWQSVPLARGSG